MIPMNGTIRTDLALEARQLCAEGELPGGMELKLVEVEEGYKNTLMLIGQPAAAGVYELL